MSESLRFRVRGPNGAQQVLDGIKSSDSLKYLQSEISKKLQFKNVKPECVQIKHGFPPRIISDTYGHTTLSSLTLASGNLIVNIGDAPNLPQLKEEKKEEPEAMKDNNNNLNDIEEEMNGTMIIKEIAGNNSCLFNAIAYCASDGDMDLNSSLKSTELREVIASIVMSDPDTYSTALLGKSNDKYIEYIMQSNTWGGAIELNILSNYYEIQINAIDIVTLNVHRFGENNNYKKCIYVIYDGIHYDGLIMKLNNNKYRYQFNTTSDSVFVQSLSIASDLNSKKKFTDVYNFGLICGICQTKLKGQAEAQKHAEQTGHAQFTQYN